MTKGEFGPDTKLVPTLVNVVFNEYRKVQEVGIGYSLVTPSGRRLNTGYTWHRPHTGELAPDEHVAALQSVMDALLKAAADHEGVEL